MPPGSPHLSAVKRILRYLQGTISHGLLQPTVASELIVYTDADWAGCLDTRKSTSNYAAFLGNNLVSWSSERQSIVSRSSAQSEYRAVANCVAKACWLRQLLQELHPLLPRSTLVYCDDVSAVYLSSNPVQHPRTSLPHGCCSCSSHPDHLPVRRHLHQRAPDLSFFLQNRRRAALHYIKKKEGSRTLYNSHHTPHCLTDTFAPSLSL